jgi:hypothetical protein
VCEVASTEQFLVCMAIVCDFYTLTHSMFITYWEDGIIELTSQIRKFGII